MNREESKQSEVSGEGGEPTDQTPGSSEQMGYYLVDETYIPTLSSLWQMPEIAREFAGQGSGLFKNLIRDLVKHLSKYTVGDALPTMMIVFHGELPSVENNFGPKEYLRIVSDKVNYSVWNLSDSPPIKSLT